MGNCVICKNSKKIKQKAKDQYARKHHHHHHHIRRDNGDILNHIEQISPLNVSSSNLHDKLLFLYPSPVAANEQQQQEASTSSSSTSTPTSTEDNNWKKHYSSLHKSKKSIKKLQETLKNSQSIENCLNQISLNESILLLNKQQPEIDVVVELRLDNINSDDDCSLEPFQLINELFELNQKCNFVELETKYKNFIKSFFIPRSLTYSQDIQLLKWLQTNFTLSLYQPINQQKFYTNQDKLTQIHKRLYMFLLQPIDLDIDLVDRESSTQSSSSDSELLFEYAHANDQIRGQLRLKTDTDLHVTDDNSDKIKSKKQFLFNFLKTSNTVSTTSLLNSKLKLAMSPQLKTAPAVTASTNYLSYYDLNERLFTCFLSNFSCQLAENFIKSLHEYHVSYIRKSNLNDYFSYIEINKPAATSGKTCVLDVDEYRFKLCLRLRKWPVHYEREYFQRGDRTTWPSKQQLSKLESEMCLLVNELANVEQRDDDDDAMNLYYWTIDYSLAETFLFRSCLSKRQRYYYYLFFYILRDLIFNEVEIKLDHSTTAEQQDGGLVLTPLKFINYERLFMHHYFRFLELHVNEFSSSKTSVVDMIKWFLDYLTNESTSGRLNRGNYFYSNLLIEHNFSDLHEQLVGVNLMHVQRLAHEIGDTGCVQAFVDSLKRKFQFKFGDGDAVCKKRMPLSGKNWCFYSKYSYIYEYIYDYTCFLYQQFDLKRDNFKINEESLLNIHNDIVKRSSQFSLINVNYDANNTDYCYLINQYEVYAEYVNKYLSQIRNYNQYLLFHYVWTMQVQYLTPFFNYVIDKYKIF